MDPTSLQVFFEECVQCLLFRRCQEIDVRSLKCDLNCSHLKSINKFKDQMKEALDKVKAALTKSKDEMAKYYD
jgi:hypothetical protein